jgi:hypothetical protein
MQLPPSFLATLVVVIIEYEALQLKKYIDQVKAVDFSF